jgi:hypothetical protein
MTTTLRQILRHFEEINTPISLNQMATDLNLTHGVLEGMLIYWVRKGKLREITECHDENCPSTTCGGPHGCPFVPNHIPRRFELATEANKTARPVGSNSCPRCD